MARVSEQLREVAFRVCDQLTRYEDALAATGAAGADAGPEPGLASPKTILTGTADFSGTGLSLGSALSTAADAPLSMVLDQAPNVDLEALLRDAARAKSEFDEVIAAGAGVAAKRSTRDLGYAGWAQSTGDRTAVNLVQRLTGSTKNEAFRQVQLGEAMGEADAATHPVAFPPAGPGDDRLTIPDGLVEIGPDPDNFDPDNFDPDNFDPDNFDPGNFDPGNPDPGKKRREEVMRPAPVIPWHEPLTRAARSGVIRSEAVTIIMRGLGAPNERVDAEMLRAAAEELVEHAAGVNADELGFRARQIRDRIDPAGVQLRWNERYENRKWRFGRSEDRICHLRRRRSGVDGIHRRRGHAAPPRRAQDGGPR